MYQCPGCGGNLKFDISSQQMKCDYCSNLYNPYDCKKDHDAEEREEFDTTIFTCPQCGAQILSDDTSAAEFCSFCGASTILTSRVSKEKRPSYIIPFKKTKEDCKSVYKKYVRRSFFTPKELKDEKSIEKFRGIYIPYWAYYVRQQGPASIEGTTSHRSGDYIITDHYDLRSDIDCNYKGLSYDGSSSFEDGISGCIGPFEVKGMNAFTPAYLSGFYADISDVPPQAYDRTVKNFANDATIDKFKDISQFKGMSIKTPSDNSADRLFNTQIVQADSAMYPVWFLAYRKKNRVAYATVNGQTGKVAADMPVNGFKVFIAALLGAVPLFLLFNLFLTIIPTYTLMLSQIMAIVTAFIYVSEINQIKKRETKEGDIGYWYAKTKTVSAKRQKRKASATDQKTTMMGKVVMIIICIIIGVIALMTMGVEISNPSIARFVGVILIIPIIFAIPPAIKNSPYTDRTNIPGNLGSVIATVIAGVVLLVKPVSDLYYYGAVILAYIGILITLMQVISKYNVLATRPLPQFKQRGGSEYGN